MNIDALKAELTAGHPDTGPYDADAATAANQLNAVNRTMLVALTMTELREWAASSARAFKLRHGIDDASLADQQRNLCIIADKLLNTDDGTLDPDNPVHVGLINQLVAAGVLTTTDRADLVKKATQNISRAEQLGLGFVREGTVLQARAI